MINGKLHKLHKAETAIGSAAAGPFNYNAGQTAYGHPWVAYPHGAFFGAHPQVGNVAVPHLGGNTFGLPGFMHPMSGGGVQIPSPYFKASLAGQAMAQHGMPTADEQEQPPAAAEESSPAADAAVTEHPASESTPGAHQVHIESEGQPNASGPPSGQDPTSQASGELVNDQHISSANGAQKVGQEAGHEKHPGAEFAQESETANPTASTPGNTDADSDLPKLPEMNE